MKKVLIGLLGIILMLCVCSNEAIASDSKLQWVSPTEEFSIWLPEDYDVFYLGMNKYDPLFKKYGISYEQQQANMASMTVDLDAWSPDGSLNIQILSDINPGEPFINSSDEQLLGYLDSHFAWVYGEMGMEYLGCEIYVNSQEKFFKSFSKFESNGKTIYGVWYFTGHGERSYSVKFYGYDGEFTEEELAELDEVVSGMYMGKVEAPVVEMPAVEAPVVEEEELPAVTYTYHPYKTRDGRVSFMVADTWVLRSEEDDRIIFADSETNEIIMEYTIQDIVEMQAYKDSFEPFIRIFTPRSELDFEVIPAKVGISALGCNEVEVEHVTGDNADYYYCLNSYNTVTAGREKEVHEAKFVSIHNGYMHLFTFYGSSATDERMIAFAETIASATYADVEQDIKLPLYIPIGLGAVIILGLILSFVKAATYFNFVKRWIKKKKEERVF